MSNLILCLGTASEQVQPRLSKDKTDSRAVPSFVPAQPPGHQEELTLHKCSNSATEAAAASDAVEDALGRQPALPWLCVPLQHSLSLTLMLLWLWI